MLCQKECNSGRVGWEKESAVRGNGRWEFFEVCFSFLLARESGKEKGGAHVGGKGTVSRFLEGQVESFVVLYILSLQLVSRGL